MKTFILIMIVAFSGSAISTQEFSSKELCEKAKATYLEMEINFRKDAICVEK